MDLVSTFAASAGIAVAQERSRRQRTRLTVLEDQERVARNLHDTVIQRLLATGMRAWPRSPAPTPAPGSTPPWRSSTTWSAASGR